jgi:hypothetical protein
MEVLFGREDGKKTLGKIIKINPKKAKVETLDEGRSYFVGGDKITPISTWNVPYSMLYSTTPATKTKITYNPLAKIENLILEAIWLCYISQALQNGKSTIARLANLQAAFGREVSVDELVDWDEQRKAHKENALAWEQERKDSCHDEQS